MQVLAGNLHAETCRASAACHWLTHLGSRGSDSLGRGGQQQADSLSVVSPLAALRGSCCTMQRQPSLAIR